MIPGRSARFPSAALLLFLAVAGANAQEDKGVGEVALREGEVISFDRLERLKPALPAELWDSHGRPLTSLGRVHRYVDVGRLTKAAELSWAGRTRMDETA